MKGRIFRYAKYKAWNEAGIITCRVNPKDTSRECARCGGRLIRYAQGQPAEGYQMGAPLVICPDCQMRGHADRNASLRIGQRLLARYRNIPKQEEPEEKPHAPLPRGERSAKAEGVLGSQDAKGKKPPSMASTGHGTGNGHGTAKTREKATDGSAFPLYPSSTTPSKGVEATPHVLRLATREGWKKPQVLTLEECHTIRICS